jgi:hypothetical protein
MVPISPVCLRGLAEWWASGASRGLRRGEGGIVFARYGGFRATTSVSWGKTSPARGSTAPRGLVRLSLLAGQGWTPSAAGDAADRSPGML